MLMDAVGDRGHPLAVPLSRLALILDAIEIGLCPDNRLVKSLGACHQRSGRFEDCSGLINKRWHEGRLCEERGQDTDKVRRLHWRYRRPLLDA